MSCPNCTGNPAGCECSTQEKQYAEYTAKLQEDRDHWHKEAHDLLKKYEDGHQAFLALRTERDALLLQVRDKDEEIASLKESLHDVLEISEVDGAVNLTTEEYAKIQGAKILLGPDSRFAQKPKNDNAAGPMVAPGSRVEPGGPVAEKQTDGAGRAYGEVCEVCGLLVRISCTCLKRVVPAQKCDHSGIYKDGDGVYHCAVCHQGLT